MIRFPRPIVMLVLKTTAVANAVIAEEDVTPHLLRVGAQIMVGLADRPAETFGAVDIAVHVVDLQSAPSAHAGRRTKDTTGIFSIRPTTRPHCDLAPAIIFGRLVGFLASNVADAEQHEVLEGTSHFPRACSRRLMNRHTPRKIEGEIRTRQSIRG